MPGLENLTLKIEIFKSANSSKRETFRFIGFDFESSKFMRKFVTSSVLCSLDMQFNKDAVVLFHGRERWRMPFTHCFPRKERAFPTVFNAPSSF